MILATIAAVVASLTVLIVIGAMIGRLLEWRQPMTAEAWIDAPFLGIAAIIVPLQNLLSLGLPLNRTAVPLLGLYVVAVIVLLARRQFGRLRDVPVTLFAVALGVYAVQGIGLFVAGVDRYLGRAWGDQINYIGLAEYLWRFPPSAGTWWPGQPAIATLGAPYTSMRVGQSVLVAFLARSAGLTVSAAFEPTILAAVFMLVLALYLVARAGGLPQTWSLIVAAAAGSMPAVAYVHLECFLSHALSLPLLVYTIALCERTARTGQRADFVKLALVIASLAAIYPEFLPFAMSCVFVLLIAGWWRPAPRWPWFLQSTLVLASPILLNTGRGIIRIFGVVGKPILGILYPWALSMEGVERLWIGDIAYVPSVRDAFAVHAWVIALSCLGYGGLLTYLFRGLFTSDRRRDAPRLPAIVLGLSLCGVASAPLVVAARDLDHTYQLYKLMLSVVPLLVIGLGFLAYLTMTRWPGQRLVSAAVIALGLAIGLPAIGATAAMGLDAVRWPPLAPSQARQVTTQFTLQQPFVGVQRFLEQQSDRPVVVCASDDTWSGGYVNAWMAYFTRDSRSWLLNPRVNDQNLRLLTKDRFRQGYPEALLPRTLVVTTQTAGAVWATGSSTSTVWQAGDYRASEPTAKPFALLCHVMARPMTGHADRADLIVPPEEADMTILSSYGGTVSLVARTADPVTRDAMPRICLLVEGRPIDWQAGPDAEWRATFAVTPGLNLLRVAQRGAAQAPEALTPVLRLTDVRLLFESGRQS